MAKSVTSLTANLDAATARMNRGDNTMGKLFTEKELYDRINSMSARFDTVAASLQQKDGTMGLLLHDKAMYDKFNGTLDEARSLIAAIKADPKKYLNIRVSLF
jgi:phospholipid/cholesterol/gamma-HCH transport system substrate-binding protein